MKKNVLFLSFLTLLGCTLTQISETFNSEFLKSIDARLYEQDDTGFIFFADTQKVLITRPSTNASGIYKLTEASTKGHDTALFKLEGTGNYNGSFLALSIIPSSLSPKIKVSIQRSKEQTLNSLQNQTISIIESLNRSSSLSIITALNPWVQTSRSGIFNSDDSENWTFTGYPIGQEIGLNTGNFIIQERKNNTTVKFDIQFRTNTSPTQSIYSFQNELGDLILLGISVDLSQERIRANFTKKVIDGSQLNTELIVFANEIKNNFQWEFGVQSDLQTPNGSLNPLNNQLWVRTDNEQAFNPQDLEVWSVAASEEVITVYNNRVGAFYTDVYIMERTPIFGIYRLSSENLNNLGQYHHKYFGYTKINDTLSFFVVENTQQAVEDKINKKEGTQYLITTAVKERGFFINNAAVESRNVEFNNNLAGNVGRSGLGTVVSDNKIYILGGYTTPATLFSIVPPNTLPPVEREVYTLEDLNNNFNSTTFVKGQALLPGSASVLVALQQAMVTKVTSIQNFDTLYAFGASAIDNQRLFLNNFGTSSGWSDRVLNRDPVVLTYQSTLYNYKNQIFLAGGTQSPSTPSGTPQPGTFLNRILSSFNGVIWNILNDNADWTPRTLPNVFVIDDEIILVGGYTNNAGTADPVNDVWSSKDGGHTWKLVNDGTTDGPPKANSPNDGLIPGVVYGGIIFMLNPATRDIIYSINRGITWRNAGKLAPGTSPGPLYGASLAVHNNKIYLIGGQKTISAGTTDANMEKQIFRVPISFTTILPK
ncbi:MAG: hypothetical protein ACRCVW_02055 [Brevinema sp.]